MTEEIKKNAEINDDELEQVNGGWGLEERAPNCDYCGVKMRLLSSGPLICYYYCEPCKHKIDIEP